MTSIRGSVVKEVESLFNHDVKSENFTRHSRTCTGRRHRGPFLSLVTGEDNIGPGLEADADDTDYDMERVTNKDNESRKRRHNNNCPKSMEGKRKHIISGASSAMIMSPSTSGDEDNETTTSINNAKRKGPACVSGKDDDEPSPSSHEDTMTFIHVKGLRIHPSTW